MAFYHKKIYITIFSSDNLNILHTGILYPASVQAYTQESIYFLVFKV